MLRLNKPCSIDLNQEPRSDVGFDCGHCQKPVHDATRWTERQFDRFLEAHQNQKLPCVRLLADVEGALYFRKEDPLMAVKRRLLPVLSASVLAACQPRPDEQPALLPTTDYTTEGNVEPVVSLPMVSTEPSAVTQLGAPSQSSESLNGQSGPGLPARPHANVRRSQRHRLARTSAPHSNQQQQPVVLLELAGDLVDESAVYTAPTNSNSGR